VPAPDLGRCWLTSRLRVDEFMKQDPPRLPDAVLDDVKGLAAQLGVSIPTTWRMVRDDPTFPRPRQLGRRVTRWVRTEVEDWIRSRPAAR
jgi:predicted DNA-binding transcriptional regulator AlpA